MPLSAKVRQSIHRKGAKGRKGGTNDCERRVLFVANENDALSREIARVEIPASARRRKDPRDFSTPPQSQAPSESVEMTGLEGTAQMTKATGDLPPPYEARSGFVGRFRPRLQVMASPGGRIVARGEDYAVDESGRIFARYASLVGHWLAAD